jgi:hypothetical protein
MKNLLSSETGFSIVQGLILSGILAGSALITSKMLLEQKKMQRGAETRDQVEELHKIIYTKLQNRKNCESTIFQQGLQAQVISGSQTILPNGIYELSSDGSTNLVYGVFSDANGLAYLNRNIIIKSLIIKNYNDVNARADLEIIYERMSGVSGSNNKRTKDGFGGKEIKKLLPLKIQRNPLVTGKPFVACYAITDSKTDGSTESGNANLSRALCLEMNNGISMNASGVLVDSGGNPTTKKPMWVWDESTATCIPNAKCAADQVYTGIDSNGEVKCRSLSDWANFNNMFQSTDGACTAGQTARIEIVSENPVRVRIKCL